MRNGALHRESAFEATIEASFVAGGWTKMNSSAFDIECGLEIVSLASWLEASQPDIMARLQRHYPPDAEFVLLKQLTKALAERGTIDVLRRGITLVPNLKPAFYQFRPPPGLNPKTVRRYNVTSSAFPGRCRSALSTRAEPSTSFCS